MHNFNTGLLRALIVMVFVSSVIGAEPLKCWSCKDSLEKVPPATGLTCNDASKLKEETTGHTEDVPALTDDTSKTKKQGCYVARVEIEGKWRFVRGGRTAASDDANGMAACTAAVADIIKDPLITDKTAKTNCTFCFAKLCNTGDFSAAADGSTTTGSSVSIRANSFIYCIVIFALFIRKFLSSDLLVK